MESLVGHTISNIQIDEDGRSLVITTRTHRFFYDAEGDCCANAYLMPPDPDDIQAVIDQKVMVVNRHGMNQVDHGGWVIDTEFYSIQTHNGDLDLELRTEHNGYLGGYLVLQRKEECWPVFDDIREEAAEL
jgi:hypothetical protein